VRFLFAGWEVIRMGKERDRQEATNKRMRKLLREALNGNHSFAWAGRATEVLEGEE
jgi:ABC-type hemin transport system ATPase subunit